MTLPSGVVDLVPFSDLRVRIAVGVVLYRGDNLILVREKDQDVWKLPGGQQEIGENDEQTLRRELSEELPNVLIVGHTRYMGTVVGPSPARGDLVAVPVYAAPFDGDLMPANEIDNAILVPIEEALTMTTSVIYRAVRLFETFRRLIL